MKKKKFLKQDLITYAFVSCFLFFTLFDLDAGSKLEFSLFHLPDVVAEKMEKLLVSIPVDKFI